MFPLKPNVTTGTHCVFQIAIKFAIEVHSAAALC